LISSAVEAVAGLFSSDKNNAIDLLKTDHRKVEDLFAQYRSSQDPAVAEEICTELTVHTATEEAVIYPVVKKDVPDGKKLEQEAEEEHDEVKGLIEQIKQVGFDDPSVPDLVQQIEEGVTHHVEEEESELFPELRARRCRADFVSPHYRLVRLGFVARMRRLGLPVLIWTINDPALAAWALGAARGVITDQPELCLRLRGGGGTHVDRDK